MQELLIIYCYSTWTFHFKTHTHWCL